MSRSNYRAAIRVTRANRHIHVSRVIRPSRPQASEFPDFLLASRRNGVQSNWAVLATPYTVQKRWKTAVELPRKAFRGRAGWISFRPFGRVTGCSFGAQDTRAEAIRRRYSGTCLILMCAVVAPAVLGCSADDDLPRMSVSGQIRLDDKLLPKGMVQFYPRSKDGSRLAVFRGAMIRNGRFSIPRELGLVPGRYTVAVFAGITNERKFKGDKGPGDGETVAKEMIPAKYNSESNLEIEINSSHAIKEMKIDIESK
jgi:hypothetical protein